MKGDGSFNSVTKLPIRVIDQNQPSFYIWLNYM